MFDGCMHRWNSNAHMLTSSRLRPSTYVKARCHRLQPGAAATSAHMHAPRATATEPVRSEYIPPAAPRLAAGTCNTHGHGAAGCPITRLSFGCRERLPASCGIRGHRQPSRLANTHSFVRLALSQHSPQGSLTLEAAYYLCAVNIGAGLHKQRLVPLL